MLNPRGWAEGMWSGCRRDICAWGNAQGADLVEGEARKARVRVQPPGQYLAAMSVKADAAFSSWPEET
jgi:hypothetical protein